MTTSQIVGLILGSAVIGAMLSSVVNAISNWQIKKLELEHQERLKTTELGHEIRQRRITIATELTRLKQESVMEAAKSSGSRAIPRRFLLALVICGALMQCSKSSGTPPPTPIPGRLGWDQQARDTAQLASFHYAILVDGVRSELDDVSCATTAGPNGFACTAALPQMSKGVHTLNLVTFTPLDVLESAPSAPLRVNMVVTGALVAEGMQEMAFEAVVLRHPVSEFPKGIRFKPVMSKTADRSLGRIMASCSFALGWRTEIWVLSS